LTDGECWCVVATRYTDETEVGVLLLLSADNI